MLIPSHSVSTIIHVMVLCWGYSIHAERRIKIFIEDPRFRVTVVSNHNYAFLGAKNVLLTRAKLADSGQIEQFKNWRQDKKSQLKTIFKKLGILELVAGAARPIRWMSNLITSLTIAALDWRILQQAVREDRPDIIFLQTLLYPSYLAYFLPKNIPQIITFWNGDVTWWAKWNGIEKILKKQIVVYGVHRAKAITVNSPVAYDACLKYGIKSDKVHLIGYPGVDRTVFHPGDKAYARAKLNLSLTSPIILHNRGIGSYNNVDILLRAFAMLIAKQPDARLIIMKGSEPEELEKHQKLAKTLFIDQNIIWTGEIPHAEMPLYYQAADVFVTINDVDSRPNGMLEAMACGTPIIAGSIPALTAWINNQHNGIIVPTRDPVTLNYALAELIDPTSQSQRTTFAEINLKTITEKVDYQTSLAAIKQLVVDTYHKAQPCQN